MKKNRKVKKLSAMTKVSLNIFAVIVIGTVMSIVYMLAQSSCSQLLVTQGELEKEVTRLEKIRQCEAVRWEQMLTADNIDRALRDNGLLMRVQDPGRHIVMRSDGTIPAGQVSLSRRTASTAQNVRRSRRRQ